MNHIQQIVIGVSLLFALPVMGQQIVTLQKCYDLVLVNYPLAKQTLLLQQQNQLDIEVINNKKLPQVSLDAQATYQSDVIEVPIPNASMEALNKDQYRATLSVNQLIYNGGATHASLYLKEAQLKTKEKQVEVSLYQLKKQVNQLYFSILLSQENSLLLNSKKALIESKLSEVKSGIKNGALLPASDKVLETELLKINQQFIEVNHNKMALLQTLSSLISKSLDASTVFQIPLIDNPSNSTINRPELEFFQYKKEEIEQSESLLSKKRAPKLMGFATGGYGNPGLNMLDNSFQTFYTVGVKLNWNVFDWNTNKKQRQSLVINKDMVDTETEIFKLNTNIELQQQQQTINKIEAFIISDKAIIELRKSVLKAADSQLKNGIITSSAYITELTNLYEDENRLIQHKILLQLTKANYNIIQGQ
ncbi:TolC family protein [Thalassobellus suaedae]|uniref:TolC family protein n=1 Tax=Thalassobellus suaedae TaxID=3074124 RepID=A0ABY9XWI8_9FLAO|nr:TolC family protein [Flavobacteriaceae bacterium HL-DH14]